MAFESTNHTTNGLEVSIAGRRFQMLYHGNSIEGGVSSDAEVRARDVVGHSGWNNTHRDAEFFVFATAFHEL